MRTTINETIDTQEIKEKKLKKLMDANAYNAKIFQKPKEIDEFEKVVNYEKTKLCRKKIYDDGCGGKVIKNEIYAIKKNGKVKNV